MSKITIPNHTQVPNALIDEIMKDLNGSELKVLLVICRKTIGWHKESDSISLTQLEGITGLSRKSITTAIPTLEEAGLISVSRRNNINKYDINYTSEIFTLVEKLHHNGEKNSLSDSEKITHTKETTTKKTVTKRKDDSPARADSRSLSTRLEEAETAEALLELWTEYREEIDMPLSESAQHLALEQIRKWGVWIAKENIQTALMNGYKGLKHYHIS